MKKKITGFLILLCVMAAIGAVCALTGQKGGKEETVQVRGYIGGEKTGFLEDEEVLDILADRYGLDISYAKAGSLDMMTADLDGRDYLFPSSSIALEYYEELHGSPVQSDIVLNTPIVFYTYQTVLEAFERQGMIERDGDVCYLDMEKLTDMILQDTAWEDIGVPELYGTVAVDTTDPVKSNSGNMTAALFANVLNGGETLTAEKVDDVLEPLQKIFRRLGYMESSSSDLFAQFLRMGMGATPVAAGYESQIIEYARMHPEEYETIKDDVVVLYPVPTVWTSHVLIALDEGGQRLLEGLLDEDVQRLAWEKHGFRTGNGQETAEEEVRGIADTVTQVTRVPAYQVMSRLMEGLQ